MNALKKILSVVSVCILVQNVLPAQTYQDLEYLKKQYEEALKKKGLQKPESVEQAEQKIEASTAPSKKTYKPKDVESLIAQTEDLLKKMKEEEDSTKKLPFIGYNIFTLRDSITVWENMPVPKDYVLGPGDELVISLWGEAELYLKKTINRDGEIFIENVGLLTLGGKTIEEAAAYCIRHFQKVYATLGGKTPTSYLDLSLGELKSINVLFTGRVNLPGVHVLHPFSTVLAGLIQAGGVDTTGSLRNIQIIRGGKTIAHLDLYDFLFHGQAPGSIRLLDQDIIYVPLRKSTIAVTGTCYQPGYYEAVDGNTLGDMLTFAGLLPEAGSQIQLRRIQPFTGRTSDDNALLNQILPVSALDTIPAQDGDSLYLPPVFEVIQEVEIHGQVKRPGTYPWFDGMTVGDLLALGGGVEDPDFRKSMDLKTAELYRRSVEKKEPEVVKINLLNTQDLNTFVLQNFDQLSIHPRKEYQPLRTVTITGAVQRPGSYVIKEGSTLRDILELTEGLLPTANTEAISIFRDTLQIAWDTKEVPLQDGDSIHVAEKTGVVLVQGEVHRPGYVTFKRGRRLKGYIESAGGFNAYADNRDIIVIYPNGRAIPDKRWSHPKVVDGSTIVVYERSLVGSSKGPTGWQLFNIISSQTANIATTLLTLLLLFRQF
jgi:protein involved in polysaccharide export with SLBB domain